MFTKKKNNNKLKGVAVVAGVASVAAGLTAVALRDKKTQKKASDFANQVHKKSSELLKTAKNKFKKIDAKKAVIKSVSKKAKS